MTSPTQLKYLDAMGIPAWVSRDIVVSELIVEGRQEGQQTPHLSGGGEVEKLLHDLNKPAELVSKTATSSETPQVSPQDIHTQKATQRTVQRATPASETQVNEIARTASHIVFACGSLQADWMVIGESPELTDDRNNQPYAGDSGVLLCNMLRAVGIVNPRESAYIVNVIKSSMQAVEPDSIIKLNQLLTAKIKEIKPTMILVVGQLSAQNLLQCKEPLARLRGKAQKHSETDIDMVVTYYPSYLLSKPLDKRKAWEDLKLAMRLTS